MYYNGYFISFLNLSDEKVAKSSGHFSVGDVNHFVMYVKVDFGRRAEIFIRLIRFDVTHFMLQIFIKKLKISVKKSIRKFLYITLKQSRMDFNSSGV